MQMPLTDWAIAHYQPLVCSAMVDKIAMVSYFPDRLKSTFFKQMDIIKFPRRLNGAHLRFLQLRLKETDHRAHTTTNVF